MNPGDTGLSRRKMAITVVLTTIGVYLSFQYLLPLIFPFVVAYFLSWLVRPIAELLYRKLKIPQFIGGIISLISLVSILGTGVCLLINNMLKQAVAFIRNMPIYTNNMAGKLDIICHNFDRWFGFSKGTARATVDDNLLQMVKRLKNNIMPEITEQSIRFVLQMAGVFGITLITLIAAVLIIKDLPHMKKSLQKHEFYQDIHKVTQKLADAGIVYIRTQVIIMVFVCLICVLGLTLVKNEYALLIGIVIAVLDALPIIGSGIFFIPWSIIMLFDGNIYAAAILITTYLFCQITREILEPKLIGSCTGITPLFTLMSMYIGIRLFSIVGFILGPIGLVTIVTTVRVIQEKAERV